MTSGNEIALPPVVGGLDGCRGGWVLVTLSTATPRVATVDRVEDLSDIARRVISGELCLVGVDMPLGLTDAGPRTCDVAARRLLGPRRSSVFPAPIRSVLHETDYRSAHERSRQLHGVGLSKQTFHLLPAIRQVDALADQLIEGSCLDRLREIHPELAFMRLAGSPLASPKRLSSGLELRRELIIDVIPQLERALESRPANTSLNDVLDAAAVAWSALGLVGGSGEAVGDGAIDAKGIPMTIWY